ncbi:MAG: glycosyltransferase family 25 protein [Neomegalonema sp.]|nr:glycosyltransferase family 25 protein [Neomegalonema sp.]
MRSECSPLVPAAARALGEDPSRQPPVYVINLDRRPDRLAQISTGMTKLGVAFQRIAAIDAEAPPTAEIARRFPRVGPLGALGLGDKCCTLSHFKAWRNLAESGAPWGVVLEDDARLAADFSALLTPAPWMPKQYGLVRLEASTNPDAVVLLGPAAGHAPGGRPLHPLLSRHSGGGGYALTRDTANWLLGQVETVDVPVDHLLFNPNISRLCRRLRPLQMDPGVVEQQRVAFKGDTLPFRRVVRPSGLAYWRRETIRGYYEISRIHIQCIQYLVGKARLRNVPFVDRYAAPAPLRA